MMRLSRVVLGALVSSVAMGDMSLTSGLPPIKLQNVVSGAAIYGVGDLTAQTLTGEARVDGQRLMCALGLGSLWIGIVVPLVYGRAEELWPGRSPKAVLLKTVLSCSIFSTIGNWITMFLRRAYKSICTGDLTLAECVESCNRDVAGVIRHDIKVWPLYDILCFAVIGPRARPVCTALASCAWSTYLSIVAANVRKDDPLPSIPMPDFSAADADAAGAGAGADAASFERIHALAARERVRRGVEGPTLRRDRLATSTPESERCPPRKPARRRRIKDRATAILSGGFSRSN